MSRHVAVDVLTGFLGSGKTTLLKYVLAHGLKGKRVALIVNEIGDVGIDGKHSYEDVIISAPDFQALYGDRIAVMGGVDVHILASGTPEQVRLRTRHLMETCGPRGRYAIGSGNSVPSYVPVDNYLAMVDEALD